MLWARPEHPYCTHRARAAAVPDLPRCCLPRLAPPPLAPHPHQTQPPHPGAHPLAPAIAATVLRPSLSLRLRRRPGHLALSELARATHHYCKLTADPYDLADHHKCLPNLIRCHQWPPPTCTLLEATGTDLPGHLSPSDARLLNHHSSSSPSEPFPSSRTDRSSHLLHIRPPRPPTPLG